MVLIQPKSLLSMPTWLPRVGASIKLDNKDLCISLLDGTSGYELIAHLKMEPLSCTIVTWP